MTKPSRCSTISTLRRARTTRTDSDRITSTSRGSLSTSAASAMASRGGLRPSRGRPCGPRPSRRSSARRQARRRRAARRRSASSADGDQFDQVVARLDQGQALEAMTSREVMRSCAFRPARRSARRRRGRTCSRVEPEEPLLVGTRRVKDQMVEAEIDVGADPLDMLVRIGRDDPAARGALEPRARRRGAPSRPDLGRTSSPPASARAPPSGACPPSRACWSVSNETLTSIMRA